MKTKKLSKKLAVNKKTVVNLTFEKMQAVQGGAPLTSYHHMYHCGTNCQTGCCEVPSGDPYHSDNPCG